MRDPTMSRSTPLTLLLLTLLALSLPGTAAAETVEVAEGEDLAAALRAASPGDTVVVGPGNFSASLVIDRGVSLRGAGAGETVISAADAAEPVVSVEGAGDISIRGVSVRGSSVAGVRVTGGRNVSVTGVRVVENGVGLLIEETSGAAVRGSVVTGSAADGIRLRGAPNSTLVDNRVTDNAGPGISLDGSPGSVLRGNEASRNSHGVFVISSERTVVRGNRAVDNDWNGVLVWNSAGSVVEDNVALRNRYGVVVDESPGSTVEGNVTYLATPLILSVLAGVVVAAATYISGWHIFRATEPGHVARAARTHRILGFTTLAAYLVVASLALNQAGGLRTTLLLGGGLGLYLTKIWSINTGRGNLGPLVGSALILKWAGLLLFYVVQV